MKILIVYESMFGNTEQIAQKIADGLRGRGGEATLADVRHVRPDDLDGCALLVVGAPTHAFSLSRQSTRDDAVSQGAEPSRAAYGVREWLRTLETTFPTPAGRPKVVSFDTRVDKVRRLPGSAAKRAARVLRTRGFELLDAPTSFYVVDVKGPAAPGELDRACAWGARLFQLARGERERDAS